MSDTDPDNYDSDNYDSDSSFDDYNHINYDSDNEDDNILQNELRATFGPDVQKKLDEDKLAKKILQEEETNRRNLDMHRFKEQNFQPNEGLTRKEIAKKEKIAKKISILKEKTPLRELDKKENERAPKTQAPPQVINPNAPPTVPPPIVPDLNNLPQFYEEDGSRSNPFLNPS